MTCMYMYSWYINSNIDRERSCITLACHIFKLAIDEYYDMGTVAAAIGTCTCACADLLKKLPETDYMHV